ncbi:MAG: hypothetical protein HY263_07805 [Chloroflexi bacterium]|nr:hypothetical protein [Chloroflexota bacterium]
MELFDQLSQPAVALWVAIGAPMAVRVLVASGVTYYLRRPTVASRSVTPSDFEQPNDHLRELGRTFLVMAPVAVVILTAGPLLAGVLPGWVSLATAVGSIAASMTWGYLRLRRVDRRWESLQDEEETGAGQGPIA